MKHGKKYTDSRKLVDSTKLYEPAEALDLCAKTGKAKFDETVEIHVRLGVDSRHADQQVRGAVVLPNGTGKSVRVLCFARGDAAEAAKAAGDFRALAVMQKNRIKNNRTDTPDEPELAFDKIVPVEFRMTDDPTVIGLQKIPNLRAKIKKMEKRYSMPDIEDADFEELPPDDDSKT